MKELLTVSREEDQSDSGRTESVLGAAIEGFSRQLDAVQVESCLPFERIYVRTRSSVYELIVLCADAADVLVRGGRFFPEFRHAVLAGATFGGGALKLRSLEVGLGMELRVDGTVVRTSTVEALCREARS